VFVAQATRGIALANRPWWRRRPRLLAALLGLAALGAYVGGREVWAEYHYQRAQQALTRHDLDQARVHLDQCLRVRRDSPDVQFLAARTARRAGAFDDAERHLRAYRLLGGVPEAVELEQALLCVQRGDVGRFDNYLMSCVDRGHPDAVLILEALVKGYNSTFRLSQAYYCLQRWLEREPDNVQALLWRGETAERLRRNSSQTLEDYRRAVELEPDNDEARLKLAQLLASKNQVSEAVGHFERLRLRQPDNVAVLLGLARCRRDLGQSAEALELAERVLAAEPGHAAALYLRGRIALEAGRLGEAEDWLRRALAASPHDREVNYTLYQCLEQQGKEAEARECLARLQKIEADLDRLAELTKQIPTDPRNADLRCEAGRIFLKNGQEEEGLRWLESALHEDPGHRPTHAALAEYYETHGRPDLAALHRRQGR
jgi:tetratricopeptide (TPR) repeat protein